MPKRERPDLSTGAKVLQALDETLARIADASRGVPRARLAAKPDKDAWSAGEIIAHLRACSDVWGEGIRRMLEEETPRWRYVSPRSAIRKTNYLELEFAESMAAFKNQREELLTRLRSLPPEAWSRYAVVDGREQTVLSYAQRTAEHEDVHCRQIVEALN